MGEASKIEWTDSTFNPWIGCTKIAPACDHCYAADLAKFRGWTTPRTDKDWGGDRRHTSASNWKQPLKWNREADRFQREHGRRQRRLLFEPRRRLGQSGSDGVAVRAAGPNPSNAESGLALAGRSARRTSKPSWSLTSSARAPFRRHPDAPTIGVPARRSSPANCSPSHFPNVWLGVTTENQTQFDRLWPHVESWPARVRFISYEPALGYLDVSSSFPRPDWIIFGGESGPHARIGAPGWAPLIQRQCADRGIAFFGKQWGTYANNPLVLGGMPTKEAALIDPPSNGKGGALIGGRLYREFPVPRPVATRARALAE